jgi:hypothetical protein
MMGTAGGLMRGGNVLEILRRVKLRSSSGKLLYRKTLPPA